MRSRVVLGIVLMALVGTAAGAQWIDGTDRVSGDTVPPGSFVAGTNLWNGERADLFVCRVANDEGGFDSGTVVNGQIRGGGSFACYVVKDGEKINEADPASYQTLAHNDAYEWQAFEGDIPGNAVLAGESRVETPLHICRATIGADIIPGKLRANGKCVFRKDGVHKVTFDDASIDSVEVLVE